MLKKKFYSFSELAIRWNCSNQDLIQAIIDAELIVSIHLPGRKYAISKFANDESGLQYLSSSEDFEGWDGPADTLPPPTFLELASDFHYLILPRRYGAWNCVFDYFSDIPQLHKAGDACFGLQKFVDLEAVLKDGVVMVNEVERFETLKRLASADQPTAAAAEKPLLTSERNTLLTIIAALAKLSNIDIKEHGKSAQYISGLTAELGASVSKRAIEEHLKKISDALAVRMR